MKIWLLRLCVFAALLLTGSLARAADAPKGLVVVATPGATDVAWPLAGRVYASAYLRPDGIDDAKARVLAGEQGPPELAELAELRAGVKGDDAASREVLAAISQKLGVKGVIVVMADPPTAMLYDAGAHAIDAARYAPDASKSWDGTIRSLERPYLPAQPVILAVAPAKVLSVAPSTKVIKKESKAFYESPWFWVAVGAAALIAGGAIIATTLQTNDTIHMQMQLP